MRVRVVSRERVPLVDSASCGRTGIQQNYAKVLFRKGELVSTVRVFCKPEG